MYDLSNLKEPLVEGLGTIILMPLRLLAILMTAIILWGVADVILVLYQELKTPPFMSLTISDILALFGAFMAVLIAIEILINIIIYLREDVIHLNDYYGHYTNGYSRKIIIMDFTKITSDYVLAVAAVTLATSLGLLTCGRQRLQRWQNKLG
ncbi:MAG: phosphate-starvation-inducible PsiE family protein [Proteobacteria bacterium]|nr:phosphate-starvation-inducible PsiE family protein [Pseudomonadota bacterium]MBU1455751.1 phosphate-starvation-inducible PsiE family protein [Pseudomonadota bacterium]